jgi:hypothetical protein
MNEQDTRLVTLPEGFNLPTNTGLHGDMLFFEMGSHQMTTEPPKFEGPSVTFTYTCWDSNEGAVIIKYTNIDGDDAAPSWGDPEAPWDVEITTGSDVWGLNQTRSAINDACDLHEALRREPAGARD